MCVKEDLSEIEKFTYLMGYLRGSAINGLPLTMDNHTQAKEILNGLVTLSL